MKNYMAPMEGVTNHIYRNAYHQYFYPMDKYFTPFISAKPNKKLSKKEINEIAPETNQGLTVIPQILGNHAEDFIQTAELLKDYGHKEVNLNLGCPSGTVTAKGKGAGFLEKLDKLDRFLDTVFEQMDIKISIKTRVGTEDEEKWEDLLNIYNRYPLEELIIHPRILKDYYRNTPRIEAYRMAVNSCTAPLCYNGDLFTVESYEKTASQFPETQAMMLGRGLIQNPGLITEIQEKKKLNKTTLRAFHDKIYTDYQELMSGDRNVLFRMKELWSYLIKSFENHEKYEKKIKKAQKCSEYTAAVSSLFAEQELIV